MILFFYREKIGQFSVLFLFFEKIIILVADRENVFSLRNKIEKAFSDIRPLSILVSNMFNAEESAHTKMQNHAKSCKTMQNRAKQCKIMQNKCKIMQNQCKTNAKPMQNHAKSCKTMQNHSKAMQNHPIFD